MDSYLEKLSERLVYLCDDHFNELGDTAWEYDKCGPWFVCQKCDKPAAHITAQSMVDDRLARKAKATEGN